MTRQEKAEAIENLKEALAGVKTLYLADIGDDQIDALVAIKSKEELIGEIITLLQSPTKNVVSALQSGGGKLSGILKTLSERAS
jgi:large subunit ribosomal protein L10